MWSVGHGQGRYGYPGCCEKFSLDATPPPGRERKKEGRGTVRQLLILTLVTLRVLLGQRVLPYLQALLE